MKKLMVSLCIFLTLGASQSNAGLLLEPYAGYQMGGWEAGKILLNGNSQDINKQDFTGLGFGFLSSSMINHHQVFVCKDCFTRVRCVFT